MKSEKKIQIDLQSNGRINRLRFTWTLKNQRKHLVLYSIVKMPHQPLTFEHFDYQF